MGGASSCGLAAESLCSLGATEQYTFTFKMEDCGKGAYLCYSEEKGGSLYLHWSEKTPENAVCFALPGKDPPKFKFTTNQGRIPRNDGCNQAKAYYSGYSSFIKEMIKTNQASKIKILTQKSFAESQIMLHLKDERVLILKESGGELEIQPESVSGIGVVNYHEKGFEVGTMVHSMFMDKANEKGGAHGM